MKIAVVTANLGYFDPSLKPVTQSVDFDFYRFTDKSFPPRHCAMTPRLQARLVKCFAWQMIPEYDFYLWTDSSVQLGHKDSVKWFVDKCKGADIAVMKHPNRNTVQEEADYLKKRLANGDKYLTSRYENELIDEQMANIIAPDYQLFASTVFVYQPTHAIKSMLKEWWYHISRFHIIDQLSLPYCLIGKKYKIIEDSFLKTKYLTHVRS